MLVAAEGVALPQNATPKLAVVIKIAEPAGTITLLLGHF